MPSVQVLLPQDPYEITIAPHSLANLGEALSRVGLGKKSRKVLIVSHPAIFKRYGDLITQSLTNQAFEVCSVLLPPGERYKTSGCLQKIYDTALENRLERSSLMIALGGGVIGDMTGFAAATWLRGIAFAQVPTSLLAMVDAAIGGKTGINHPLGKNLIGAFHQPKLVWIDPIVLKTLPMREFRAAMAEVIKYSVIWDAELFTLLSNCQRLDQLRYVDDDVLMRILCHCTQAKSEIVAQDEKEAGVRALLNFGHTIGHAIESISQYRLVNHGEAVAIGMVAASQLSVITGLWQQEDHDNLVGLLQKAALPLVIPDTIDREAIITALTADKKVEAGKVRFVLPTCIGHATISDEISEELVRQVI